MKTLYTAVATSVGGRGGHVETDDQRVKFDLTPFTSKEGTNPEQLFAAGYAGCFGSAVDAAAKKEKIDVGKPEVQASVTINQDDSGFSLAVELNVTLSCDQADAERIVVAAHQLCPYSKATRGNIPVDLKVNGLPLQQTA